MKSLFKYKKKYINLTMYYNKLFRQRLLSYKIIKKHTCDMKFPIFMNKVILFQLRGIVSKKHKRSINSSITIGSYLSNTKLFISFPLNYSMVKIN